MNQKKTKRRASQKSAIAAEALPHFEAEAKKRMSAGGGDQKSGKEIIPDPIPGKGQARDKVAAQVGVNPRYVRTQRELAHVLDVSRESIARRMQSPGSPGKTAAGYDVEAWREHLRATSRITKLDVSIEASRLDRLRAKREALFVELARLIGPEPLAPIWEILKAELHGPGEMVREKRAHEWLLARREEVRRDLKSGKLKDQDAIMKVVGEPFAACVQAINAMKHQIASEVAGLEAGEAHQRIREAIRGCMEQFSLGRWAEGKPYWGTIKKALDDAFENEFGTR